MLDIFLLLVCISRVARPLYENGGDRSPPLDSLWSYPWIQTPDKVDRKSCLAFLHFDSRRIGAVAKAEYSGQDEQRLYAQALPYPAAEERDEYGDEMVHGNARGDRSPDFVGIVRDVLDVYIGSHRSK